MTLQVQLFGTPALHWNGSPVRFDRRKAMALLSYLAVTRRRHHRDTLATLLWPESEEATAHAGLRNLLWMLRKTPIAGYIQSDRSTVAFLEDETLSIDVNRFRDLVRDCPTAAHGVDAACAQCEPRLAEAMRLRTGPFMHGYAAANSTQFDEWQLAEGAALNREASETLSRMIEYYLSIQDWCATARYARQWIGIDLLNELGYRALMKALLAQGKRSEALQVYDECVCILREELGLAPEDTTSKLASALRDTQDTAVTGGQVRGSRLPQAAFPLIGRSVTSQRVEDLLLDKATRLVSLVGLGGVGKTSLALHVGRHVVGHFADGAAYVSLDSSPSDSSISSAVVRALNLAPIGGTAQTLNARLADVLHDHHLLLILDGVEGLVPQVAAFAHALETASGVRILATSRIEIGIAGEIIVPLEGLEVPDKDADPQTIADCASVRLLHLAAERQGMNSPLDVAELHGMARLARQLEGSPLGLEMAAGWHSILSWDAIADRISSSLDFLVHRRKDVAPRHRTMAAVFEQSWEMLPSDAQVALERISVFQSAFSMQAAEYVTESSAGSLAVLVNRGLLKREGPELLGMHELLHQFAAGRLNPSSAGAEALRARHLEYYTMAVVEWLKKLKGAEQYATLFSMERELGNLHLAFQYAAVHGATGQLRDLCEGVHFYYDMRTLGMEGETVFARAAEAYGACRDRDHQVEAFLWVVAGYCGAWHQPDLAAQRIARGMDMLQDEIPHDRLHAIANTISASLSFGKDREANGRRLEGGIAFYREHGDRQGEALALAAWAMVETYHDKALAEQLGQRSLQLHREIEDRWGESLALHALARLAEASEKSELALSLYEEAWRLNEPFTRNAFGVISSILARARMEGQLGHVTSSMQLAEQALHLGQEGGYSFQAARAHLELGRANRVVGDTESAKKHLTEAFSLLRYRRWSNLQSTCAQLLVEVSLDERDSSSARFWLHELSMLQPENPALAELREKLRQ